LIRFLSTKVKIVIGSLLIATVMVIFVLPRNVLIVRDVDRGENILMLPVSPGDKFSISFINSVENLPVIETFVIDKDYHIVFSHILYQAYYVGYIHEEKAKAVGKGFTIIPDINQRIDKVTFFMGFNAKHTLGFNDEEFPLYEMAQGGDLIVIEVKKKYIPSFVRKQQVTKKSRKTT